MIYKDGTEIKDGDVIRWNCWDSDDSTTWNFTGIKKHDHIVYLGGGIDFGAAIGKRLSFEEVLGESEDNDFDDRGITKVGEAYALSRIIAEFATHNAPQGGRVG